MFLFINTSQNNKLAVALVLMSLRGRTPSGARRTDAAISSEEKNKILIKTDPERKARVLDKIILNIRQNHSEKLLPAIEKILKRNKASLKSLVGIGVVRGPGSFTGVRVGVATANSLGFALAIPVVGVKYEEGRDLIQEAFKNFAAKQSAKPVMPVYNR